MVGDASRTDLALHREIAGPDAGSEHRAQPANGGSLQPRALRRVKAAGIGVARLAKGLAQIFLGRRGCHGDGTAMAVRSEERRGGTECVSTCGYWWRPYP